MKYDEFINQVKQRAGLESREVSERVIAAVLATLSEHMAGREPHNLAAQLPDGIAQYLGHDPSENADARGERFSVQEFFERVGKRENVETSEAEQHSRVVIEVLGEAVTEGEFRSVRAQFPAEYDQLFDGRSIATQ
ncbi:MAG: DUF2267 domain-containing protein [Gemmatimonadaceae bacterium]|nr:DUF2267 domain-containing protein [Gloeobacterales cyanobacterium ES-bin-141]